MNSEVFLFAIRVWVSMLEPLECNDPWSYKIVCGMHTWKVIILSHFHAKKRELQ